jgi:hypothetical protein
VPRACLAGHNFLPLVVVVVVAGAVVVPPDTVVVAGTVVVPPDTVVVVEPPGVVVVVEPPGVVVVVVPVPAASAALILGVVAPAVTDTGFAEVWSGWLSYHSSM